MPPIDMPETASSKAGITWPFEVHKRSVFRATDAELQQAPENKV